jgi:predicted nucleic acid-binding protein
VPDYAVIDTTVLAHLTKVSSNSRFYIERTRDTRTAIPFQVEAELLSAEYAPSRALHLTAIEAAMVRLPHSDATSAWYARVALTRKDLRRRRAAGGGAGDADVWIVASTLEHRSALVSHDAQQVALARASNVPTYTALPALRAGNPA